MVYAKFGGQTECIMGNWKIENTQGKLEKIVMQNFGGKQGALWSL